MLNCIFCLLIPLCFSSTVSISCNLYTELIKSYEDLLFKEKFEYSEDEIECYKEKEKELLTVFTEKVEKCIKNQIKMIENPIKKQDEIDDEKGSKRDLSKFNTFYKEFEKVTAEYANEIEDITSKIECKTSFVEIFLLKNMVLKIFCVCLAKESISMNPNTSEYMILKMSRCASKAFYCLHEFGYFAGKEELIFKKYSKSFEEEIVTIKMLKECADRYIKNIKKIILDSNDFEQRLPDSLTDEELKEFC